MEKIINREYFDELYNCEEVPEFDSEDFYIRKRTDTVENIWNDLDIFPYEIVDENGSQLDAIGNESREKLLNIYFSKKMNIDYILQKIKEKNQFSSANIINAEIIGKGRYRFNDDDMEVIGIKFQKKGILFKEDCIAVLYIYKDTSIDQITEELCIYNYTSNKNTYGYLLRFSFQEILDNTKLFIENGELSNLDNYLEELIFILNNNEDIELKDSDLEFDINSFEWKVTIFNKKNLQEYTEDINTICDLYRKKKQ